jgi:hypothetical protein
LPRGFCMIALKPGVDSDVVGSASLALGSPPAGAVVFASPAASARLKSSAPAGLISAST